MTKVERLEQLLRAVSLLKGQDGAPTVLAREAKELLIEFYPTTKDQNRESKARPRTG